ncbi:MAG: hypothetical protein C0501_03845 [Isosphaera sp.]|nr:hypothetical protein [Isosphaera sp.]
MGRRARGASKGTPCSRRGLVGPRFPVGGDRMASVCDLAASLPGELDLLAAVAADPADDTVKLVYADWLDEHDDPRGPFLRRFVSAARAGTDLPEPAVGTIGWRQIVGVTLEIRLRSHGLTAHRDAIFRVARPAVAIHTEPARTADLPVGGSQFGGLPSLPAGAGWPRCEEAPLEFLAQFDLAELRRTVAGRALPPAGLMSFFVYHDYDRDAFGGPDSRGVPGGLRIIHTPPGAELVAVDPPDDYAEVHGRPPGPCRLTLTDGLDVPESAAGWPEFDDRGAWSSLVRHADHQLFGYTHVTVLAEDPTPGPDWEQLVRFDSDRNLRWGWGDGHRLFWYIRSADLRAGRFDDTVAIDG